VKCWNQCRLFFTLERINGIENDDAEQKDEEVWMCSCEEIMLYF
jgi:hypothetical protein